MNDSPAREAAGFATTQWSLVIQASASDSAVAIKALDELCRIYWDPLYSFARRSGCQPEDACDMVQGFISALLERGDIQKAAPQNGKLRSFLLAGLRHYLINDWKRSNRQKRGGGATHLPLDLEVTEQALSSRSASGLSPDALYDRRWALKLLDGAIERLKVVAAAGSGRSGLACALVPFVIGEDHTETYAQLAQEHGTSEGAVKMAAQRLRARFREILQEQVRQTVADPADAEAELKELIQILRE